MNASCVVCGKKANIQETTKEGQVQFFCCYTCYDKAKANTLELVEQTAEQAETKDYFANGWRLEIQESEQFIDKNIVVLVNAKSEKLYMRAVKKETIKGENYVSLEPLTKAEMQENNLVFEESKNEQFFNINIEESESEPLKPTHRFNTANPEDMKKARDLAEKMLKKFDSQEQGESSTETEESEEKKIVGDIKEKISLQLAGRGIEISPEEIRTQSDMERWIGVIKNLEKPKETENPVAGGTAPLSGQSQTNYGQQNQQGFDSMESLIDNLRDRSSHNNPNPKDRAMAKSQLDALMLKAFKGQEEARKPFSYAPTENDKGTIQILKEKFQRRKQLSRGIE